MKRRLALAVVALAVTAFAPAPAAQEPPQPTVVQASGTFPLDLERRLVLDGLSGDLVLQLGKPGEIRFLSRLMGKKDEVPVALYEERGTIVFRPVAGETFTARTLQVTVPPEVRVRVVSPLGGKVTASGLQGGIEIAGRALNVDARGLGGDLELDLEGGTAVVSMVAGTVRLRGKECNATFDGVAGALALTLAKGAVAVRGAGSLDVDIDEVDLKVERIRGAVNAVARRGTIEATLLGGGGEFRLTGTVLALTKSKGEFTVSSDADIRYGDMEAALHFDVYGGSVRGEGNKGILEVRTRNAEVQIARNQGAVRVQGDGAKLSLAQIDGDTVVFARTSDVTLDDVKGSLSIECDRGDLVVKGCGPSITATATGGEVRMEGISGSITLQADSKIVDIFWANLSDMDSRIVNEGGDVTVRFAATGGGGRIEARSKTGRVTSEIPRVHVLEDGSQAQGSLGNIQRPVVVIEAARDIQILGGG